MEYIILTFQIFGEVLRSQHLLRRAIDAQKIQLSYPDCHTYGRTLAWTKALEDASENAYRIVFVVVFSTSEISESNKKCSDRSMEV